MGKGRPIIPRFTGSAGPSIIGGKKVVGMGWHPDVPDRRDRTLVHKDVVAVLKGKGLIQKAKGKSKLPRKVDNRKFCSPIEDQGTLGSCTAHAVVGMMEYMMRRSSISHVDLSRRFLYKVTRKLLGWTGDTGAYIRTTIQSAAVFGVPPEKHFPYDVSLFEEEGTAFHYSYASNFQALNYARLDAKGQTGEDTLEIVKKVLAANFVVAFGFPVYSSISNDADVPYPTDLDSLEGGHAVLAVGYDDDHASKGTLIFRNSWDVDWGDKGYGYLPYEYVIDELALDFWTIFKQEWIDPKQFKAL